MTTKQELVEQGRKVWEAVNNEKNNLYVGQVVTVCRPIIQIGGSVAYIDVKGVVLQKFEHWFLVEDLVGVGMYTKRKRRWGVRYEDLVCGRWYRRDVYGGRDF